MPISLERRLVPWLMANLGSALLLQLLLLGSVRASSDSVVVFSEIMYYPALAEDSEWVELHNQMTVDIDLSRWRIEGGIDFASLRGR